MLPRMRTDPREIAAIFIGGMIGALARGFLTESWGVEAGAWPWATFAVNIVGAFLLGYFVTRMRERLSVSTYGRPVSYTHLTLPTTPYV